MPQLGACLIDQYPADGPWVATEWKPAASHPANVLAAVAVVIEWQTGILVPVGGIPELGDFGRGALFRPSIPFLPFQFGKRGNADGPRPLKGFS